MGRGADQLLYGDAPAAKGPRSLSIVPFQSPEIAPGVLSYEQLRAGTAPASIYDALDESAADSSSYYDPLYKAISTVASETALAEVCPEGVKPSENELSWTIERVEQELRDLVKEGIDSLLAIRGLDPVKTIYSGPCSELLAKRAEELAGDGELVAGEISALASPPYTRSGALQGLEEALAQRAIDSHGRQLLELTRNTTWSPAAKKTLDQDHVRMLDATAAWFDEILRSGEYEVPQPDVRAPVSECSRKVIRRVENLAIAQVALRFAGRTPFEQALVIRALRGEGEAIDEIRRTKRSGLAGRRPRPYK